MTADVRPEFDPHYPHRYFVSYAHRDTRQPAGLGFGGYATSLTLPIIGLDDLSLIVEGIKQLNPTFTDITILGWQKFEDLP